MPPLGILLRSISWQPPPETPDPLNTISQNWHTPLLWLSNLSYISLQSNLKKKKKTEGRSWQPTSLLPTWIDDTIIRFREPAELQVQLCFTCQGFYQKLSLLSSVIYLTPGSSSLYCNGHPCSSKLSNGQTSTFHWSWIPQRISLWTHHLHNFSLLALHWDQTWQRGPEDGVTWLADTAAFLTLHQHYHLRITQPQRGKDNDKTAVSLDMQETTGFWNNSTC